LVVKVGALAVILFMPTKFALDLQLLGGVWMIQIFPAVIFGLFTRWFSGWALFVGWAAGMVLGTWLAWAPTAWTPIHKLFESDIAVYNGLIALAANIVVAAILSAVLPNAAPDDTIAADYEDRPGVEDNVRFTRAA
jgi:SSS family solute:Na+ symporter